MVRHKAIVTFTTAFALLAITGCSQNRVHFRPIPPFRIATDAPPAKTATITINTSAGSNNGICSQTVGGTAQDFVDLSVSGADSIVWKAALDNGSGPTDAAGFEIEFQGVMASSSIIGTPFIGTNGSPIVLVDNTTSSALTPRAAGIGNNYRYAFVVIVDANGTRHVCKNISPFGVRGYGVHVQQ